MKTTTMKSRKAKRKRKLKAESILKSFKIVKPMEKGNLTHNLSQNLSGGLPLRELKEDDNENEIQQQRMKESPTFSPMKERNFSRKAESKVEDISPDERTSKSILLGEKEHSPLNETNAYYTQDKNENLVVSLG